MKILLLFALLLASVLNVANVKGDDELYTEVTINGIVYLIGATAIGGWTQYGGELSCESNGMRLACFETVQEFEDVRTFLRNFGLNSSELWLGAERSPNPPQAFEWSTGGKVDNSMWCPGQPTVSDAVYLDMKPGRDCLGSYTPEATYYDFLCEKYL